MPRLNLRNNTSIIILHITIPFSALSSRAYDYLTGEGAMVYIQVTSNKIPSLGYLNPNRAFSQFLSLLNSTCSISKKTFRSKKCRPEQPHSAPVAARDHRTEDIAIPFKQCVCMPNLCFCGGAEKEINEKVASVD
jgi:hypothetical protein